MPAYPDILRLESTTVIDPDLGITLERFPNGCKKFSLDFGSFGYAQVYDIPAATITNSDRDTIVFARGSYLRMWGDHTNTLQLIMEDKYDGFPPNDQQYLTRHQIGTFTSPDGSQKLVTNRKVAINPKSLTTPGMYPDIFDDIAFWQVENQTTGERSPLLDTIAAHLQESPYPRLATISRTGTRPYTVSERDETEREKTAIAWAMMQVATTHEDDHAFFACMLCEELQTKVLSIRDPGTNQPVMLDFTKTADTLNLGPNYRLVLDRQLPYVQNHLLEFPGYWTNNDSLHTTLTALIQQGRLTVADLSPAAAWLLSTEESALLSPEQTALIIKVATADSLLLDPANLAPAVSLFTKPRFTKFLIHTLAQPKLRHPILDQVQDGPFSSLFTPKNWGKSVKQLLAVAKTKYQE